MEKMRLLGKGVKRTLAGVTVLVLLVGTGASGADDSRLFTTGFEAFSGGDSKRAAQTLGHLLEVYPGTKLRELTLFYLARAHFRTGNQEAAAQAMARLLQEYPGTSLAGKAEKGLLGLVPRYRKGEKLSRGDDDLDVLPVGELAAVNAAPESGVSGADAEKAEQNRLAKEKQKADWEKADRERLAREEVERARLAMEKEKAAREKAEQERLAREQAERERVARQKAEAERQAREKTEQERLAQEEAERARLAMEKEKAAREKAEQERLAREQVEHERTARQKAELERQARDKTKRERLAQEEAERTRLAMVKEKTARANAPTRAAPTAISSLATASGAGADLSGPLLRAVVKPEKTELSPGERIEYLVTLLNVGSGRAEGVALRLMFPDGEYEPVDFAKGGFRYEGGGALVLDNVSIESGQALEYPVVFRVRSDAGIGQELRCSVRLLNGAIGTWDSYRSRASFVRAPRRP